MLIKKNSLQEVTIQSMALGGKGIGYIEDEGKKFVIFVEKALPFQKVLIEIFKTKKNYGEGRLIKVLDDQKKRPKPRCTHFGECGGCTFQHMAYEDQLFYKEKQVRETLAHVGGFSELQISPIIGCDERWYYRNKMEWSFGFSDEKGLRLGLHYPKSYHKILDIHECFLQSDESNQIRMMMKEFCGTFSLPVYDFKRNTGLLRSVLIREGKKTDEIMLNLVISDQNFPYGTELVETIKKFNHQSRKKKITSLYLTRVKIGKGAPTKVDYRLLFGHESLKEILEVYGRKLTFQIHPQSFFQTNTLQAEILYKTILDLANLDGTEIAYDLFCGIGAITLFLSFFSKKVYGIEIDPFSISQAKLAQTFNNISNVDFRLGNSEKGILTIAENPQIICVDPPRPGLTSKLVEHLIALSPEKIVYVSCNPATLARDLKLFSNNYRISKIQPVDMFPQTAHIEVVALLDKFMLPFSTLTPSSSNNLF